MEKIVKKILILLILSIVCLSGVYGATLTDTQARNLVIGDSHMFSSAPTSNYGSLNRLELGTSSTIISRFYIAFNLSKENINYNTINDAILYLNQYQATDVSASLDIEFYYCNGTFDESTITWNNQATGLDCSSTPFDSISQNSGNGDKYINLTGVILQDEFSIKVQLNPESFDGTYRYTLTRSSEYLTTTERPRLNIDYNPTPTIIADVEDFYNTSNISIQLNTTSNVNMSYILNSGSKTSICNDCNNSILNLTSLIDGLYNITFISDNSLGQANSTYNFTIDTTNPNISFNNGTEFNYQFSFNIDEILNISCSDTNFANCTIYWEDNTTSFSSTGTFTGNKTVPEEIGNFTFNIVAYDLANNMENVSGYIYINPFRFNISFYSDFSGNPLYNVSLTETTLGSLGNSGSNNYISFFANPATYNFTVSKTGYRDNTETLIKDNITVIQYETINLSATFNFTLRDERTLELFNLTPVSLATMQVICLDQSVIQQNINSTNFVVELPCPIRNIKFILDYTSDSYFRSILVDETEINRDVYLIDLTTTQSIFNTFTLFDLTNVYENPRLSFKKYVGTEQVEITGDVVDVEGKVPGYFILNDQYIMELSSDNLPTKSIGFYSADTLGDKVIKLFSLNFAITDDNTIGKVRMYSYIENGTVFALFNDTSLSTIKTEFFVYNGTQYGNLLYQDQILSTNTGSFSYNIPSSLENASLFIKIVNTNSLGEFMDQRLLKQNDNITLGLINFNLSMDWIIIVFIGFIALAFTAISASVGALILLALAALFVTFGWFNLSWVLIGLGLVVAILSILKQGEKK